MEYKDYEIQISYKRKLDYDDRKPILKPIDVYEVAKNLLKETMEHHETFYAFYVDSVSNLISINKIAEGGLNYTLIDQRFLFQGAILSNAYGMILIHNHPSGKVVPSNQDKLLLEDVKLVADKLNIKIIDFVVVSAYSYYSMAEEGKL